MTWRPVQWLNCVLWGFSTSSARWTTIQCTLHRHSHVRLLSLTSLLSWSYSKVGWILKSKILGLIHKAVVYMRDAVLFFACSLSEQLMSSCWKFCYACSDFTNLQFCRIFLWHKYPVALSCNGSVLDYWSQGRWFDSHPVHCKVTTLGKLFTHIFLSPSSIIWY